VVVVAVLAQAGDGKLYGTTYYGGSNGVGTIFRITTNGVYTNLYSFTNAAFGFQNVQPGSLVPASDGKLYGATSYGATNNLGMIFRITTNGIFTNLYTFTGFIAGGYDGVYPAGGLVQAGDGKLYGTTIGGGTNGAGTIFQLTTNGVFSKFYSFTGGNDGYGPNGNLIKAADGNLYGTASGGGAYGHGTVFRFATNNNVVTTLYSFAGDYDGASPNGGLVQTADGNLYGTTSAGGGYGYGTVFRVARLTNQPYCSLVYTFTGGHDGANPNGNLAQAVDGTLYGTTSQGGDYNYGTVFQLTTNGALSVFHTFNYYPDGARPQAGFLRGSDGNLYGTTLFGGNLGGGLVFRLGTAPATLNISSVSSGGNQSVLYWPAWEANYVLQSTTNLASTTNWVTVSNAMPVIAVLVTNSPPAQFFRLVKP